MHQLPWLKAMEHGALGEARAKAFLMNRFWILERSVDAQGADLIIQLNTLRSSLLDSRSPKFGVVQVKYVQDGSTSITVPVSYTQNSDGSTAETFFLIVCTDVEDEERMYMLTAEEIEAEFDLRRDGQTAKYTYRANRIINHSNYQVVSRAQSLDRVERALRKASVITNRQYFHHLGNSRISRDHLDEDYFVPLMNKMGDIPDAVLHQKVAANQLIGEMESVIETLHKITYTSDPMKIADAQCILDKRRNHWGDITFSDDLSNDELLEVAELHKVQVERLREAGILGAYTGLLSKVEAEALRFAADHDGANITAAHLDLIYKPGTLTDVHIRFFEESAMCQAGEFLKSDAAQIVRSKPGVKSICFRPDWALGRDSWHDARLSADLVIRPIQRLLDQELFGMPSDLH